MENSMMDEGSMEEMNTEHKLFDFINSCSQAGSGAAFGHYNPSQPSQHSPPIPNAVQQQERAQLRADLDQIHKLARVTSDEGQQLFQQQEMFIIQYQESAKRQYQLDQLRSQAVPGQVDMIEKMEKDKLSLDMALRQRAYQMIQARCDLMYKYNDMYMKLRDSQMAIVERELAHWRRSQQLSGNQLPFENNLDEIQTWCEIQAETLWTVRMQLRRLQETIQQLPLSHDHTMSTATPEKIHDLITRINGLLQNLVSNTFVVEKQPPQVMKTNTRFTATVRLLSGAPLNVQMNPPTVKVQIIGEMQAHTWTRSDKSTCESSGEILNNTNIMEYHSASRQLSVNFRNMQLRKIKRAEKKGTESVMDEKFALLFQTQFKIGGGELIFSIWVFSLPVVVIVHGNQEPDAWATVTWDNAFAPPGRAPFVVPDKVIWQQVGEMLSLKYKYVVGRGLSEENLHFLAGKVYRNPNLPDYSRISVSWSQFAKEALPDRNFTFWEWFYALLKVTKEHLRPIWNDGAVKGFVGRKQAEEMLLQKPLGTFLIRFSDSEPGGVTIAWVGEGQEGGGPEVLMLQPFTNRDLAIRSLSDRINDLKNLVYLYPDIPKDNVFGKYYSQEDDTQPRRTAGYVKPILKTHIPGLANSSVDSYPNTPQSVIRDPHSPSEAPHHYDNPSVQSGVSDIYNTFASSSSSAMGYMNGGNGGMGPSGEISSSGAVSGMGGVGQFGQLAGVMGMGSGGAGSSTGSGALGALDLELLNMDMSDIDIDLANINMNDLMGPSMTRGGPAPSAGQSEGQ